MKSSAITIALLVVTAACTSGETPQSSKHQVSQSTAAENGLSCWSAPPASGTPEIMFSDQTADRGLDHPLVGMHGHAAVWADLNGDDHPDLFVGTFADRDVDRYQFRGAEGPSPDRFLYSTDGGFTVDANFPEMFTRTSGGAVADFDNDGDLDLVLSRNWDEDTPEAPGIEILRNDDGSLVVAATEGLPKEIGGRSVGILDFDGDGLQDIFVAEDRWSGGRSVLLRNLGGFRFEDATEKSGLPSDVHGLGVAVADLNNDGYLDIFVAGSNRLFLGEESGTFRELDSDVFRWEIFGEEDDVSGVSIADLNRDGLLDIAVGHHYNSTLEDGIQVPVRVYLNLGPAGPGDPRFEDVTEVSGLDGLPTKAPHITISDFDNDGWPDLLTTASNIDGTRPVIYQHQGLEDGVPKFSITDGSGGPQYWIAGPIADADRDGRLDVFLVEWEPALPSLFLRNETASGHWLEVSVGSERGFGIGWRVEIYQIGGLGDVDALLGARDISVTEGYSTGIAPVVHFGLGEIEEVAIRLIPPRGGDIEVLERVTANQHVRFPGGCT